MLSTVSNFFVVKAVIFTEAKVNIMSKVAVDSRIEEIKRLLDEQSDLGLLDEVLQLLKPVSNPILREKLTSRALRSEEDIKHGRVYTVEEVRKNTQRFPK